MFASTQKTAKSFQNTTQATHQKFLPYFLKSQCSAPLYCAPNCRDNFFLFLLQFSHRFTQKNKNLAVCSSISIFFHCCCCKKIFICVCAWKTELNAVYVKKNFFESREKNTIFWGWFLHPGKKCIHDLFFLLAATQPATLGMQKKSFHFTHSLACLMCLMSSADFSCAAVCLMLRKIYSLADDFFSFCERKCNRNCSSKCYECCRISFFNYFITFGVSILRNWIVFGLVFGSFRGTLE